MKRKMLDLTFRILLEEGFTLFGVVNKKDCHFDDWMSSWLKNKYHADMLWMEKYQKIRKNPTSIEGFGRSLISAAMPYHTRPPKKWTPYNPISNYAWGEDYHLVVRKKLERVIEKLREECPDLKARAFVDTAPLPEKLIALKCGLGWIGKNGMLINRHYGSYLFLGEILTDQDMETTGEPVKNYCGTCTKCIDACPTNAIISWGVIDSSRCISYLTIEKRGDFSETEKQALRFQIFGCDICQQVCPWNKKAPYTNVKAFSCSEKWLDLDIDRMAALTRKQYDDLKIKSPVKRTKFEGFIRNARTVLKNRKQQS